MTLLIPLWKFAFLRWSTSSKHASKKKLLDIIYAWQFLVSQPLPPMDFAGICKNGSTSSNIYITVDSGTVSSLPRGAEIPFFYFLGGAWSWNLWVVLSKVSASCVSLNVSHPKISLFGASFICSEIAWSQSVQIPVTKMQNIHSQMVWLCLSLTQTCEHFSQMAFTTAHEIQYLNYQPVHHSLLCRVLRGREWKGKKRTRLLRDLGDFHHLCVIGGVIFVTLMRRS